MTDEAGWTGSARARAWLSASRSIPRAICSPTPKSSRNRTQDISALEPIRQAIKQDFSVQQIEFAMEGKRYLGIYRRPTLGLIVVSMTDKAAASPPRTVPGKDALSFAVHLHDRLPHQSAVRKLAQHPAAPARHATREIAHGNFDTDIIGDTATKSATLARSFAQMGKELKARACLLEQYNAELETKVRTGPKSWRSETPTSGPTRNPGPCHALAAVGEIAGPGGS